MSAWDDSLRLTSEADGRFSADISGSWNAGTRPNGGYTMAVGLRAMSLALPFGDPFTGTCHFLAAADVGAAAVEVEKIRAGRTLATATARMIQGGTTRTLLIGTFGDLDKIDGPSHRTLSPPQLPAPEDCVPSAASLPNGVAMPIAAQADIRFPPGGSVAGDGQLSGRPEVSAWLRLADGRAPDLYLLCLAIDAFAPAVLELGLRGWSPTIELTIHFRAHPAPGWLRVVRRTNVLWKGYFEEDAEVWDSEGTLVAQGRQFARLGAELPNADGGADG